MFTFQNIVWIFKKTTCKCLDCAFRRVTIYIYIFLRVHIHLYICLELALAPFVILEGISEMFWETVCNCLHTVY